MMNIGDCNWRFSSGQSKADSFPREAVFARYGGGGAVPASVVVYG